MTCLMKCYRWSSEFVTAKLNAKTCAAPAAAAQLDRRREESRPFKLRVTPNNKAEQPELAQMETHMPMDEEVKAHLRQARQAPRALLAPLPQHIHTSNWQPFQEVDSLPLHATGMALDCRRAAAR